jgi:FkbM family methyltransferase
LTLAVGDKVEVRQFGMVKMGYRPSTVDYDVCYSSIVEDEYHLRQWNEITGWAIDIGAHVGAVTVALAAQHPTLRVLAVEIVPENVAMLHDNLERNGVADRVTIVTDAAGGPDEVSRTCFVHHRSHPVAAPEYVEKHRYIGNSFWSAVYGGAFDSDAVDIPVVSLGQLLERHGIDEVAFMKIDAEGAEWAFLRDPAISRVKYIIGEYHWDYAPQGDAAKKVEGAKPYKRKATAQQELQALLGATHMLDVADHPTIGHFEARLR